MDNNPAQPDWSLLPNSPREFFALQSGFDRKDLKRAYNKWLRVFRPEKSPAEFQKIREAYESLEWQAEHLSSHIDLVRSEVPNTDDSAAIESKSPYTENSKIESIEPTIPNIAQERKEDAGWKSTLPDVDPRELYHLLKAKKNRSADDFAALAVLSDSLMLPDPKNFALWLLDGLEEHPQDGMLISLLRSFFGSSLVQSDQIEHLLERLSSSVDRDNFYHLAEPLLDKYLKEHSWTEFKRVLAACQAKVDHNHNYGYLAYQRHLLRKAVWKAPYEECSQLITYLEKHGEFDRHSEFEFEINLRLLEYIRIRQDFLSLGPISQMIDRALRSFCFDDEDVGIQNIAKCQQYMTQHPEQLLSEYPVPFPPQLAPSRVWLWVSECILQELVVPETEDIDPSEPIKALASEFKRTSTPLLVVLIRIAELAATIFAIFFAIAAMLASVIPGIIFLMVYFRKLKPDYIDPWFENAVYACYFVEYKEWCRDSIARLHASTHISFSDAQERFQLFKGSGSGAKLLQMLHSIHQHDMGMEFYACAVKFDR